MSETKQKPYYGWVIVLSAFIVIFLHLSIRGSFASFLSPMQKDLGWTTAETSLALSIFMVFYGLTAFFAGGTSTKYGPKIVTLIHGIIFGLGLFLSSYATKPWHFYLTYGVMGGIGAGALFAPPTAMVRRWFLKDLAKALGFATAGAGLGFLLAPNISMILIETLSWQQAMRIFGVVLGVGVVIAALFMKRNPEDIGLKPLGYEELAAAAAKTQSKVQVDNSIDLKSAVRTGAFWTLAAMWVCSNFAEYIVFSHSINYAVTDLGFTKLLATRIYSLIGLFFFLMGIFAGAQIDKYAVKINDPFKARKTVLAIFYTVALIAAIVLNYATSPVLYAVYAILFGIAMGTYVPTVAGYVGTVFGRKYMGPIWGLVTLIGMAGGAGLGPYFGGWLRDLTGNYDLAIWVATIFYAITFVLCLSVKKPSVEAKTVDEKAPLSSQAQA
jgi:MFS family permease